MHNIVQDEQPSSAFISVELIKMPPAQIETWRLFASLLHHLRNKYDKLVHLNGASDNLSSVDHPLHIYLCHKCQVGTVFDNNNLVVNCIDL